ncbi:MAG: hypothetical protein WD403_15555, partial [Pirellulales bacterium]
ESGEILREVQWRPLSGGLVVDLFLGVVSVVAVAVQTERWFCSAGRFQFRVSALLGLCVCVALAIWIYKHEADLWIALLSAGVTYHSWDASALIRNARLFCYAEDRPLDWYLWLPLFFSMACAIYLASRLCVGLITHIYRAGFGRFALWRNQRDDTARSSEN